MCQMEVDCDTRLEGVAVDHWNTDNPHLHVVVRGMADNGKDLVIAPQYISYGFRSRPDDPVPIELGPKPEHEIQRALQKEIMAQRWTRIDREIMQNMDDLNSVDLRTAEPEDHALRTRRLMIGRFQHLEKMGLAATIGPSQWSVALEMESTLCALGVRNDIIKTMHLVFREQGQERCSNMVIEDSPDRPIIGRLVDRGLHDEHTGAAYAIIDGVDGKAHYIRMKGIEVFDDAPKTAAVSNCGG